MRLVFVNHAHPDILHVSGMRLGCFAREMARRGHRVILLTCALPGTKNIDPVWSTRADSIGAHDWSQPLIVSVPAVSRRYLDLIRQNRLPRIPRRALTLWQFIAYGGVFEDWQSAARATVSQLAVEFKPDLVWGTFGNTTNLSIAQHLAHQAGCPWAIDIKDNWETFIPKGLRRMMAWRFRDAVGWTSNSRHHQQVAQRWFSALPTQVIYSGVADEFFQQAKAVKDVERRQLLLLGGIYDDARLRSYLMAVREWINGVPPSDRHHICFTYAGTDGQRVLAALKAVSLPCEVNVRNQVSISEVADLAAASFATAYLRASFTFHQKLLELLVCGRPLICYPGESAESKSLAGQADTMFAPCVTESEVRDALAAAWARRMEQIEIVKQPPWRWAEFAKCLDEFFQHCARKPRT